MLKMLRIHTLTPLILCSFTILQAEVSRAEVNGDCHQFRTQTQGGWGSSAAGNNPGAYRDAHFDAAFPEGITLGCNYTLTLTSAAAVQAFLPSGGPAAALSENSVNPPTSDNVLAGQLLALTLSVGFDAYDPQFSPSSTLLSEQVITSGPLAGYTVAELLEEANKTLGACKGEFSLHELNAALTAVNENYVDGISAGSFLECPEAEQECAAEVAAIAVQCSGDHTYEVGLTLAGTGGGFEVSAPGALGISAPVFCADGSATAEVVITFAQGTDYSFSLIPSTADGCPAASCALPEVTGTAPDCCTLELICPEPPAGPFACIEDIPPADTDAVTVGDQCGEVNIIVSESASGTGCQGNPYRLIRTYTATDGSNMAVCVQTLEAVSLSPPVIVCPPDQHASCDAPILPDAEPTAESQCGGPV